MCRHRKLEQITRFIYLWLFLLAGCASHPVEYYVQPNGLIMKVQGSKFESVDHIPEGATVIHTAHSSIIGDVSDKSDFECESRTDAFGTTKTNCRDSR